MIYWNECGMNPSLNFKWFFNAMHRARYRKSPTAESEFSLVFFFHTYLKVIISPFSADMNHCEQEFGEYLMGNPSDMMLSVSSLYSSWKQSVEFI